jgi:DUF438 domain-containing protein
MSELIDNTRKRKELLKHLILQLHEGKTADAVRKQLIRLLGKVPYSAVVEVEQELIREGLPAGEVLKLCDVHGQALKGVIDQEGAPAAPPGHPVHTFRMENEALDSELLNIQSFFLKIKNTQDSTDLNRLMMQTRQHFNNLMDVDKHYRRKENLLFPYLEKYEITGPPTVMWGKDDEIRELLKGAQETLSASEQIAPAEAETVIEMVLRPAASGVEEMIYKEEEILFPMCLDILTEAEWFEIYRQSDEIGYCLYDPEDEWKPEGVQVEEESGVAEGKLRFPSGAFTLPELTAALNTLPVDLTFVDRDDTVRFFSQGKERIFDRNRAILGRKVQMCHPPSSVHVVQKILDDFRSGKQDKVSFWINLKGRFIFIEYYAVRGTEGEYLGTLEVTQDLTDQRKLEGEQRLLNYEK